MSWLSDREVRRLREVAAWPEFTDTRYVATEELGRGGMGAVYRATDETLGREVALKVSSAAFEDSDLDARLRSEARTLARLEHPGIVPIHDAGRLADGRSFYVMKRVEGRTLGEHLAGVEGLPDRLRLFERLCEPVAFAHSRGVVHRDLKPDNVMVGPFGEVLVMDWGVAKAIGDGHAPGAPRAETSRAAEERPATAAGTVLGTRGYMAPEQADGAGAGVDAGADIYALGAILYTLLAGSPPPDGADAARAAIDRRRDVARPLRAIVRRAMAPLPGERYAGAADVAADVRRFRDGLPVSAHRENLFERSGRVLRRYRVAVLLVLAYLVMRALVQIWLAQRPAP